MSEKKESNNELMKKSNEKYNKPDGYKNINSSSEINLNGYKYDKKTETLLSN